MRLAWQCGQPHSDFILCRLTPEQVNDVQAFAGVEPLRERRDDLRAATVALVAARAAGCSGVTLSDLLEGLDPDARRGAEREQTPEEMDRAMARVAASCEAGK